MTDAVDITPEGMLTPNGVRRVNEQLEALTVATTHVANTAVDFFRDHRITLLEVARGATPTAEDCAALREALRQMEVVIGTRDRRQDALLRAVAGHPAAPEGAR